ncbi:hypothetical protein B9Z55_003227 [Caenorhabditis nigoni]|uniref:Uncharacterized protein n=1 Tax=Caenorhabditis nigoni TaxID=1611254 RepID=A0A2G5VP28_9PELO|nr:hypothetical protein B9Z55_003227 [Caenorhabditis nigoni]
MSRFFIFALLAMTIAVTIAHPDNARKFRSCGHFLNLRIDRVCGGTCSIGYDALREISCSTGLTDGQLTQICCP